MDPPVDGAGILMLIDTLRKIAVRIQSLRLPFLLLSLVCLIALVYIVLTSTTHVGDRFLIPSLITLLWSLSGYAFILNFRSVPESDMARKGFFKRLVRRLHRFWYWLLALLFFSTSLALFLISFRLLRLWLQGW